MTCPLDKVLLKFTTTGLGHTGLCQPPITVEIILSPQMSLASWTTCNNNMPASKDALASHADVLRGFVTRSCPTSEAGTRDEPLRTSAWEARDAPLAPAYRRALFFHALDGKPVTSIQSPFHKNPRSETTQKFRSLQVSFEKWIS